MSQFIEVIAKRTEVDFNQSHYQTLYGHAFDCAILLKQYLVHKQKILKSLCESNGVSFAQFSRGLFISIILHDIGKATQEFQQNIRSKKHSQNYPHAFFAVPILFKFFFHNRDFLHVYDENGQPIPIELLSILAHHTQLYDNMYKTVVTEPLFLKNNISNFFRQLEKIYRDLKFYECFLLPNKIHIPEFAEHEKIYSNDEGPLYKQITEFIQKAKEQFLEMDTDTARKMKALYCLCNSVLKTCDALASRRFDELVRYGKLNAMNNIHGSILSAQDYFLLFKEITLDERKVVPDGGWRPFQKKLIINRSKYVILRAPCGRGKTRPALVWARNIATTYDKDKIIFAMPTQVTSNAMSSTLTNFCKAPDIVGLFHGRSFVYLRKLLEAEHETLDEDEMMQLKIGTYESSIFHKPVVVTTLDHVIYSTIHGFSKADQALGNLLNSVIVFDEAHYYDFKAMQSFATLLRLLRRYEVPHLVMSGTLPAFFIQRVNENGDYTIIEDEDGLKFKPFQIRKSEKWLVRDGVANSEIVDQIIHRHLNGENGIQLRQTVILNTVARAQIFYLALRDRMSSMGKETESKNIVLYHSQFTFADRSRIEKERILENKLLRPYLIVGTQAIEVSLDISCDIMYSEIAPIDSIGQRAGRLNRGGRTWNSDGIKHTLYLFKPESDEPYNCGSEEMNIIDVSSNLLSDGEYSYEKIRTLCDLLYRNRSLGYDPVFEEVFRRGVLFGPPYWTIADEDEKGKPGFKFRNEEIQTIFVIPDAVYQGKKENLSAENEVRVPCYKLLKSADSFYSVPLGSKKYIICTYPMYDREIGFNDLAEPPSERMGSNVM
jgi:CRISPR-associated endonuclease/helicase Cas3